MTLEELEFHSRRAIELLTKIGVRFAVVGGMAVSFRAIERLTKDLDLAVAVEDDVQAQRIVHEFSQLGFLIDDVFDQEDTGRMSTVRMISPAKNPMFVDFLFASSGIENEIVDNAEEGHLFSNINVRVATTPCLIAIKVLSARESRMRDIVDLQSLFEVASSLEIAESRRLLDLITERGYNRSKDLQAELDKYIAQFQS